MYSDIFVMFEYKIFFNFFFFVNFQMLMNVCRIYVREEGIALTTMDLSRVRVQMDGQGRSVIKVNSYLSLAPSFSLSINDTLHLILSSPTF